MTLLHVPWFLEWASGHMLCRVEGHVDRFAITFDDGPSPRFTPRVLDVLAAREARATFFVLGRHVRRAPHLVRRLVEEGHEVGLHGDGHVPPTFLSVGLWHRQVERAEEAIAGAAGVRPVAYRAPFGLLTRGQAALVEARGYRPVLGDVYPEDPRRPGVARIVRRVVTRVGPGSIVILHDASALGDYDRGQTVDALDAILEDAARRGLRAVSVAELLGESGTR